MNKRQIIEYLRGGADRHAYFTDRYSTGDYHRVSVLLDGDELVMAHPTDPRGGWIAAPETDSYQTDDSPEAREERAIQAEWNEGDAAALSKTW